ncbi:class I SAM-dependent methyltransferase [Flavobacteriales bacterium]|nr:class I SAM-dependent methyltransferase [Flavobacteriales bacterium]
MERALKKREDVVELRDFGAGCPAEGRLRKSSVASMAKSASSDPRKGQWLMAAAHAVGADRRKPVRILELGTCLGSGGDYLLSGAPKGSSYLGLEGSASLADLTRRRLQRHADAGMDVRVETGPFDQTLPEVISAKRPFDLVFLDGCHEGEILMGQWQKIQPLLAPNGIVVVDDIRWSVDMHAAWLRLASDPQLAALDLFRMGILTPDTAAGGRVGTARVSWRQRA